MRLAIVDLEATTPEPETARIVEIAVCLWDVKHRLVTSTFSTTVRCDENPAEHVNGLPPAALANATLCERAFATVGHFTGQADVLVAHNGDGYDRPVLERHECKWAASKPWIDTMDVEWPKHSTSRSLIALAAAHGVGIGTVHRAIDDVLLVARLFERAAELGADLDAMIARARRPKVEVHAQVPQPWNMAKDAWAKLKGELTAAGFRFDGDRKVWCRRMPAEDVPALPFDADVKEVA